MSIMNSFVPGLHRLISIFEGNFPVLNSYIFAYIICMKLTTIYQSYDKEFILKAHFISVLIQVYKTVLIYVLCKHIHVHI